MNHNMPLLMPADIQIEYLRKKYRNGVEALQGISLNVPSGCIFALLGPNGAGKSTLIKSLLTIIRPTECRGFLLGEKIGTPATLARVGYLPEQARFPHYLTGRQIIEYSAAMSGMSPRLMKEKLQELLTTVGMVEAADRNVSTYSKGMRQRIGIAQALIHNPQILFLDEPTDGVDPIGREEIKNLIQKIKGEGRTVFLNSHQLEEIEQVADRVAIMNQGKIICEGSLEELSGKRNQYHITTQTPPRSEKIQFWLEHHQAVITENQIRFTAESLSPLQEIIDMLREEKINITNIQEERRSLTEIYKQCMQ